jgi:hypothetical protein
MRRGCQQRGLPADEKRPAVALSRRRSMTEAMEFLRDTFGGTRRRSMTEAMEFLRDTFGGTRRRSMTEAMEFLRDTFGGTMRPAAEIREAGALAGFRWRSIQAAAGLNANLLRRWAVEHEALLLTRSQFDALVIGLPWQRIGAQSVIALV